MREILLHGKFEFSRQNYNVPKIWIFLRLNHPFFSKGWIFRQKYWNSIFEKSEFSRQNYNVPKIWIFLRLNHPFFQKGESLDKNIEIEYFEKYEFSRQKLLSSTN